MWYHKNEKTYFLTWEPRGVLSLRLSIGYIDTFEEVWELTFDI